MGSLTLPLLAAAALGYLLGSIPFGLILTRAAGLGDIRKVGSGNIGATNVLRTGNKGLAAATLLLDALKGTAAVVLATAFLPSVFHIAAGAQPGPDIGRLLLLVAVPWAAALGALVGHVYPVWLGFKGGKGVATYLGALIGVHWMAAVVFALTWLVTAAVTRISSLSALAGLVAVVLYFVLFHGQATIFIAAIVLMSALVAYKHSANIQRLLKGEEPKIGAKG
jgi:glycerol-3-phosphate acyltransferase PlsY